MSHPSSKPTTKVPVPKIKEGTEGGALANFQLVDVIQMCCISQKSGRLTVRQDARGGAIYFSSGQIVHAEAPSLEGEEAIYEMIGWDGAKSFLKENVESPQTTIAIGWEHLLMEGARRRDERRSSAEGGQPEWGGEQLIGQMVGPFRILEKIGSDSWGVLFEAVQVAVNRTVALKVMNPDFYADGEKVQQFITFASSMAQAQNPYLTAVYEAGEGNGMVFYAREYLGKTSLKDRLQEGRLLSEDVAIRVIINAGDALNYERKNNIPHLPLAMEHLLIPDTGVPKLFNNVCMEGEAVSEGELQEIRTMSGMVQQGLGGSEVLSPEFQSILKRMDTAAEGETCNWDILLRELSHLELNRRAKRAVIRSQSTSQLQAIQAPPERKAWVKWVGVGGAVLLIAAGAIGYFFFRAGTGAADVDSMIQIPEGSFTYQTNQKISLPTYYIDKYEVTIGQYRKFMEAWKQDPSAIHEHPNVNWKKFHEPNKVGNNGWESLILAIQNNALWNGNPVFENTPVFNVDYYDAWAYAHWIGKRLPTEQEWEKAARGPHGNLFPWGNTFDPKNANTGADAGYGPSDPNVGKIDGYGAWAPVGAMRRDRSPYGVMDMAGNVSEWTDTWTESSKFPGQSVPVVRGGNFGSIGTDILFRDCSQLERQRSLTIGFRCVSEKATPPRPASKK